ncbi:MAG TPA: RNA 3'-terminal phosphate cyclase [Planctomycetaceae bacterium]|nr:RNA 3'-terminal phosphate cyclase [Planctomycetaceae bacterium]
MTDFLHIDGSRGEGGGQILRSSLALSMATDRPVRFENLRANRPRPGLLAQHLTAANAAAEICGAETAGIRLRSRKFEFVPGTVRGGEYTFEIGTAGSTGLVLQTVLPVLIAANEESRLILRGGTHNMSSPPFEFLKQSFLPLLQRMGPRVDLELHRHGFYPAGGGEYEVKIAPAPMRRLELTDPVEWNVKRVTVLISKLPEHVAERELAVIESRLKLKKKQSEIRIIEDSPGSGNVILVELRAGELVEVVTGFGQKGVRAEQIAQAVAREAKEIVDSRVPVGSHLADQLLVPLALGAGGSFLTSNLSSHSLTNIETLELFLGPIVEQESIGPSERLVRVLPSA